MKVLISLLALGVGFNAQAAEFDFRQAKKALKKLYATEAAPTSFYCGCAIEFQGKKLVPDLDSCGYQVRKQPRRANRIEFEHVVSAWEFGHQRQCWQSGGRKNCKKTDPKFRTFEGDLHNLFPAVGELNGDRSNYRFGMVTGSDYVTYGECAAKVVFPRRMEPPKRARGTIARTYFYMADKHGLTISRQQRQLFQAWDRMYPPSVRECRIHSKVRAIQGDSNPYIAAKCN